MYRKLRQLPQKKICYFTLNKNKYTTGISNYKIFMPVCGCPNLHTWGDQWLFLPLIHPSLQRSLSKEEDIKRKYDGEIQKLHVEKVSLTDQLEHALQERNVAMQERNFVIQERNALALQLQQEYERAERQDSSNHCTICWFQMAIKF